MAQAQSGAAKTAGGILRGFLALLVVALVGLWIFRPLVTVEAGTRAVVFSLQRGTLPGQLDEGMHFLIPFIQRPIFYDVRTRTYTMSSLHMEGEVQGDDSLSALTSDGQVVNAEISVRFRPDAKNVYRLHQKIGPDYVNKIIRPEIRSKARVVIAEFAVEDVYSARRELVVQRIGEQLTKSLAANDIIVDEVLLRNIQFSPAFAAAIEQKQIAQQNAQRMQYVLLKAELTKQQRILEAQGDARSIDLRGQAIAQNARVVQYEYARKLAPNVGTIVTDGRTISVPFAQTKK